MNSQHWTLYNDIQQIKFISCASRYLAILTFGIVCSFSSVGLQASGEMSQVLIAPWFPQSIRPVGQSAELLQEAAMLSLGIQKADRNNPLQFSALMESFVSDYPNSVWTPWLQANLGDFYLHEGAYTRALYYWQTAWEQNKVYDKGERKRVADYVLANYTRLLAVLGRFEQFDVISVESKGRIMDRGPLTQKYLRTCEYVNKLRYNPSSSYLCGWHVINEYAQHQRGKGIDKKYQASQYQNGNLFAGCSMSALIGLGTKEGFNLIPIQRPSDITDIPIPSIMHMKQNHYVTILGVENNFLKVYDPIWGTRLSQLETLNNESSGYFLVEKEQYQNNWKVLTEFDTHNILGRCWFTGVWPDEDDGSLPTCPPPGSNGSVGVYTAKTVPNDKGDVCGSGSGCGQKGMPTWYVSEPCINLWVKDTPISCNTPYGGEMPITLFYKQRNDALLQYSDNCYSFGRNWGCELFGYVVGAYYKDPYIKALLPNGETVKYVFERPSVTTTNYYSNSRIDVIINNDVIEGYTITLSDGTVYYYKQVFTDGYLYYISQKRDNNGYNTYYNYSFDNSNLRLTSLEDHNHQTVYTFGYTNVGTMNSLIDRITDRYNNQATLHYELVDNSYPMLFNITDSVGLLSTFEYDANGWINTLTTPYGTTTFTYDCTVGDDAGWRCVTATDPNYEKQIYLFLVNCSGWPDGNTTWLGNYPEDDIPSSSILPPDTLLDNDITRFNSFYWNQKQSPNVPSTISQITTNQFNRARMRHWLSNGYPTSRTPDLALSLEQAPCPDDSGNYHGQVTWYDYTGKTDSSMIGTQIMPSLVAKKLPDGSTWYQTFVRNVYGLPTNKTETYTQSNGQNNTRTWQYVYDSTNNIDLVEEWGPENTILARYQYDSSNRVTQQIIYASTTNSYTNQISYDSLGRLYQKTTPTSQVSTHYYGFRWIFKSH